MTATSVPVVPTLGANDKAYELLKRAANKVRDNIK